MGGQITTALSKALFLGGSYLREVGGLAIKYGKHMNKNDVADVEVL